MLKTETVSKAQRIPPHIPKPIPPPIQPNRIPLRIPPRARRVRAEVVVVQLGLGVKVLPRVAQVERDFRDAGGARGGGGGLAGESLGPNRGLFVAERTVRPLPGHLAVGLGEFAGGVQVVAVDGVGLAFDHCRYGHGAAGGG